MLSREDNKLLTRTGPGTPMGELIRRYWLPVLFTHQLLDTVREFQNGATPPGLSPASYPVRSGRFVLPKSKSFIDGMEEFLRIRKAAAE